MNIQLEEIAKVWPDMQPIFSVPHDQKHYNKLVELKLAKAKRELNEIGARISDSEIKYNMQSEDFAQRFHAGSVSDSADFMEWISFIDMQSAILNRVHSSIRDTGKEKQRNRYE